MSIDYGNLCSVILKQCFGETVQIVADCLFSSTARTLSTIIKTTARTKKQVTTALAILIKYQLVSFKPSDLKPNLAEYSLNRESVLYILRYSRYVHLVQTKYGTIGAAIAEELLHSGSQTATNTLLRCLASADNKDKAASYRSTFLLMIKDNYLIKLPRLLMPSQEGDKVDVTVPKLLLDPYDLFTPPEIELLLISQIQMGTAQADDAKDSDIFWRINFERFHQDFRDAVMIGAIERKIGPSAGECFKYILQKMYERTDPWQRQTSNAFTFVEVKHLIDKTSNNLDLIKYLDQYMTLITDDSLGFMRRVGDMGGDQYVIEMEKAFEELAMACVEKVITERYGSKASRIFRVVRAKKYIEQEDLQKEAMIPAKEAKFLSYNLFTDQFLHIKTIRKAGGGGSGPAKAFFLFHLKQKQTVQMMLDICYKALYNTITRSNFEKSEHKRLIEKSQKVDSIVATMKERGASEEYISEIRETLTPPEREILENVKRRIITLSKAELTVDDTIFLLQMYLYHSTHTASSETTPK